MKEESKKENAIIPRTNLSKLIKKSEAVSENSKRLLDIAKSNRIQAMTSIKCEMKMKKVVLP